MLKKWAYFIVLSFIFTNIASAGMEWKKGGYSDPETQEDSRGVSCQRLKRNLDETSLKNIEVKPSINFENISIFAEVFSKEIKQLFPLITFLSHGI